MSELCDLACSDPWLDICDVYSNPRLGNASILNPLVWRFLPLIDVQVDHFMSRDLDSRINPREVAAVRQFYSPAHKNKSAHFMRDHPAHNAFIMGGMWGMKIEQVRELVYTSFKKLLKVYYSRVRTRLS